MRVEPVAVGLLIRTSRKPEPDAIHAPPWGLAQRRHQDRWIFNISTFACLKGVSGNKAFTVSQLSLFRFDRVTSVRVLIGNG